MFAVGTDTAIVGYTIIISVAIATSVTAPLLLSRRMDRQHREDRQADWARQDAVAAQAEEAARLLKANNALVAATAVETQNQLSIIRADVNSNLTAQIAATRDATAGQLATMQRLIPHPDVQEAALIRKLGENVAELDALLRDRKR